MCPLQRSYSVLTVCVYGTESSGNLLNVTADEAVVVEGDEQMFWRVRWSWREDRPRNNEIETYHVRVQENGGGGDLRWLEVTGKVRSCCSVCGKRGKLPFLCLF